MKRLLCWLALCLLLSAQGQARAESDEVAVGALRFAVPDTMASCAEKPPAGTLYAARSADGRWAMAVTREATRRGARLTLDALAARYADTPRVTVGERYQLSGVEFLPLWEHRPEDDIPCTIHMVACVLGGTLYRFVLIDRAAAGPEEPFAQDAFAALHPLLTTKEASP